MSILEQINSNKELRTINEALNRYASGKYCNLSIDYCCDRLAWLHKFNKCDRNAILKLVDKATELLDGNYEIMEWEIN